MDRYRMTRSRTQGEHVYTVIVARGCPFKCGFCSRIHGKAVRFHSVDRVLQEVELLIRDYGATEINFEADTITMSKRWMTQFCVAMTRTALNEKIRWTCESRVDTVTESMLEDMRRAGCWQISYGVETGSQRLLDLIQKGTRIKQIERTFAMTKNVGISIRAFYMLGLPTETAEETQQTIDFAKKLDADWSQFTLYTPFPGTDLWDLAQQESPISKNWSDFRTHAGWTDHKPAWVPKGRTAYVDSPVYFDAIWPVRELNWRKLGALLAMTNGEKKLLSGTALDLACGNGVLLPSLSRMFNRVIGIDLHPEAAQELVASQGLRNVEVLEGNAYYLYYLPILQESVDVVFATSCLEHFQHLGNAVSELKRVLKPNGKIFYLSPTENNLYRLGRAMLGYTKPSDHYWSGQEIHENLDCNFNTEKAKGYPAFMPIYTMGKYAKKAQQKSA
jgi:SAM-dependent methyltransferase